MTADLPLDQVLPFDQEMLTANAEIEYKPHEKDASHYTVWITHRETNEKSDHLKQYIDVEVGSHVSSPQKAIHRHAHFVDLMSQPGSKITHFQKHAGNPFYTVKVTCAHGQEHLFTHLKQEGLAKYVDIHGVEAGFVSI